ncbi:sulfite exporter TauE/SafE family protein [Undibacterium seohonense]|uniref:Sulfite exporter TauE/SafE family protein n=1 Tax=Undibacterium seohonense TaxID=1344950 RepID=A0ABR6X7V9_9BURK|nr:sulfite exporter TauE/SafE family protein [Undibacterium seohonense]MBC3808733.1 sulfite exporter TauE/SafE family protein [Undibacterium seohonense]
MLTLPLMLAAISAGLIGGFHCVGMCGGIASILTSLSSYKLTPVTSNDVGLANADGLSTAKVIPIQPVQDTSGAIHKKLQIRRQTIVYQLKLHGGRLSTYMLIGAFFGGLGAASLQWKADLPVTRVLFILGNVALVFLGVRLSGFPVGSLFPRFISEKFTKAYGGLMRFGHKPAMHPYLMGLVWGGLPCGLSYAIAPFALLSGAAWSGAVLMLLFGLAALPHLLIAQAMSRQLKQHGMMFVLQLVFAVLLISLGLLGLFYFDMKNMPDFLCITPTY